MIAKWRRPGTTSRKSSSFLPAVSGISIERPVTRVVPGDVIVWKGGTLFAVGVGYQFNNWFRGDITGQYRGKSNFKGTDLIGFPCPFEILQVVGTIYIDHVVKVRAGSLYHTIERLHRLGLIEPVETGRDGRRLSTRLSPRHALGAL